ncbi:hypothetical protein BBJ28_00010081 [Nothophytophthora sp. Chile5]|nr:hypothetical protein BBJ28_00010081 [Nothophytophthora sp. Chile5]
MTTPVKALIQERLRAKMIRRGSDYDLDDEFEFDSDRLERQSLEMTSYDLTTRGDDEDIPMSSSTTLGISGAAAASTGYPMRLHTHIDPSAYLVPSQHDERYYSSPVSYPVRNISSHSRRRYARHSEDRYHESKAFNDPPSRWASHQPQHSHHHRDHESVRPHQRQHYGSTSSRGGYETKHQHPQRSFSPAWHHPEGSGASSKAPSKSRSAVSTLTATSSPRGHRKQDYRFPEDFEEDEYLPPQHGNNSTPSSPEYRSDKIAFSQPQRLRYHWNDRDHQRSENNQHILPETREASPAQQHHHGKFFPSPTRSHLTEHPSHPNQTDSAATQGSPIAVAASALHRRPEQAKAKPSRHLAHQFPSPLDMGVIEAVAQSSRRRIRAWDAILSPGSRLAAKAFVEKRQRRADQSTPRTIATQRWLQVVDARASGTKQDAQEAGKMRPNSYGYSMAPPSASHRPSGSSSLRAAGFLVAAAFFVSMVFVWAAAPSLGLRGVAFRPRLDPLQNLAATARLATEASDAAAVLQFVDDAVADRDVRVSIAFTRHHPVPEDSFVPMKENAPFISVEGPAVASAVSYTYILVDIDAPDPEAPTHAPFLHYLVAGLSVDEQRAQDPLQSEHQVVVPYYPVSPPVGEHRYVSLLFRQLQSTPEGQDATLTKHRTNFDVAGYAAVHELQLVANSSFHSHPEAQDDQKE